jgi:hypothetical protein
LSEASGGGVLHRIDPNAELAQPAHVMSYDSISLALI